MKAAHRFIFALCACAPPLKIRVRSFATAALLFCAVPAVLGQTAGSVDFSFDPGSAVVGTVNVVAPAGNGKVYVGGNFHTVRGAVRYGIARLNPDGTADQTFDPGSGPSDSSVSAVAVQTDGMVLIAGYFTSYNGVPRIRVARLFSDGSLDTTFDPASGPNGGVYSIAQQADGKVLIAGVFTQCAGVSRNSIARLNADGSLDATSILAPGHTAPIPLR